MSYLLLCPCMYVCMLYNVFPEPANRKQPVHHAAASVFCRVTHPLTQLPQLTSIPYSVFQSHPTVHHAAASVFCRITHSLTHSTRFHSIPYSIFQFQPTAKEVFLEMLVDHLLEAGDSGAVVPWYNVRKDLFLDKVRWRVGGGNSLVFAGISARPYIFPRRNEVGSGRRDWCRFLRGFPRNLIFFLDKVKWGVGGGTGLIFAGISARPYFFLDKVRWEARGLVWFCGDLFPRDLVCLHVFPRQGRREAGGGTGFCGDFPHVTKQVAGKSRR